MPAQPTSAIALQEAERSGQLNGKRFEVARAFELYGPGTSAEVLRRARLDKNRNLMRARVTELADLGWLKPMPARKCAITGRKAIVWSFERTEPRKASGTIKASKAELATYIRHLSELAGALADDLPNIIGRDDLAVTFDDGFRVANLREYVNEARAAIGIKPEAP